MCRMVASLLLLFAVTTTTFAQSTSVVPSEPEIDRIIKLCAAGRDYTFAAGVRAAVLRWRNGVLSGAIEASAGSIGAALKPPPGSSTSDVIYATYAKCLNDTIARFFPAPISKEKSYTHLDSTKNIEIFPSKDQCPFHGFPDYDGVNGVIIVGLRPRTDPVENGRFVAPFSPKSMQDLSDGDECFVMWDYLGWQLIGLDDSEFVEGERRCIRLGPVANVINELSRVWADQMAIQELKLQYSKKLVAAFSSCLTQTTGIPRTYANRVFVKWLFQMSWGSKPLLRPTCEAIRAPGATTTSALVREVLSTKPKVSDILPRGCISNPV